MVWSIAAGVGGKAAASLAVKIGTPLFMGVKTIFSEILLPLTLLFAAVNVFQCFSPDLPHSMEALRPGIDSELLQFTDTSSKNFLLIDDLKDAWDFAAKAKEASRNMCKLSVKGVVEIAAEIANAALDFGVTTQREAVDQNFDAAFAKAQNTFTDALMMIDNDINELDKRGADNENYSGSARAYFENGTEIVSELDSLSDCLMDGLGMGKICPANVTFNAALLLKSIIEKNIPEEPTQVPYVYNISKVQWDAITNSTLYSQNEYPQYQIKKIGYKVALYNSLVGTGEPRSLIYELYDIHLEFEKAKQAMENENTQLKASFADAKKTADDLVKELKDEEIRAVDAHLLGVLAPKINKHRDSLDLSGHEGTANLAADYEHAKEKKLEAERTFNNADRLEKEESDDYLYNSIVKLKEANLKMLQVEESLTTLKNNLNELKELSRTAYEKMIDETKSDFLSEACQSARKKMADAYAEKTGNALQMYNDAMLLLQACAATPLNSGTFEAEFARLGKVLKGMEGRANITSEKAILKALQSSVDYMYAPQMQEKLIWLDGVLRQKAAPLEKQILLLREKASNLLSVSQDFKENIGTQFTDLSRKQSDFLSSLNLDVFENIGTLFDKYQTIIDALEPKIQEASKSFLEKYAKTMPLFSEIPTCNQKTKATLITKIRNPTPITLAANGLALQISSLFTDPVFVYVGALGPGEEIYDEQEVFAESGRCKYTRESLQAGATSAQWLVNLDVQSFTEKLYVETGGERLLLSGDKEGWSRLEKRRISSDSPLVIISERTMQRASDNQDRYSLRLTVENTMLDALKYVTIEGHLGANIQKVTCEPDCAVAGDSVIFMLNKLDGFQKTTLVATYVVDNISFELNYTLQYLKYLTDELLNKSASFRNSPLYEQYFMVLKANEFGQYSTVLTDGKKLITELKKALADAEKKTPVPENKSIDAEAVKRAEKTFTDLNNKIAKLCQISSCSTVRALYDEAYLKWKQKSLFDVDAATKEFEKKATETINNLKDSGFSGLAGPLEKFKNAVDLKQSLKLKSPIFAFSDYQTANNQWSELSKINSILNAPIDGEQKLLQLSEISPEKLAHYREDVSSLGEKLNESISLLKEEAKREVMRAKEDSKKANAYFENIANAEEAFAKGEYNNAIAYALQVPSIAVEKADGLSFYLLLVPLVGIVGAFAFILRRPKKQKFMPKTFKEAFYDEPE